MTRRSCFRSLLLMFALAACRQVGGADAKPVMIEPGEARQHVGETVSVTFKVKASKYSSKRKTVYLDSEEEFQNEHNLGLAISQEGLRDLAEQRGIHDPADYFLQKTIRVVGKIELREERPYLPVDAAKQIEEVKELPNNSAARDEK